MELACYAGNRITLSIVCYEIRSCFITCPINLRSKASIRLIIQIIINHEIILVSKVLGNIGFITLPLYFQDSFDIFRAYFNQFACFIAFSGSI